MRVDPLLVIASAAVVGGLFVAAPVPVLVAAGACAVLLATRTSWRVLLVAALVLAGTAFRASHRVRAFESLLEATRGALGSPRRCAGVGVVSSQPAWRGDSLGFTVRFTSLDCEGRAIGAPSVRLYGGPVDLARGDRVEVIAQLAPTELFRNAELPDPTPSAARSGVLLSGGALSISIIERAFGVRAFVDRARAHVRERIDATFAPLAAPMARALVLGENDLSADDGAAFRASGLAHLLAVSGTHLVFAVLGIVGALRALLCRIERLAAGRDVARISSAFGALLALLYADFAGGSGSALRAAWMLAAGLGARALGRRPSASRAFAMSLIVGVALDPSVGLDVSFMLSAAATAGLFAIGQPLAERLVPKDAGRIARGLVASIVATVSAMLPCIPLLALLGPTLTVAGIVANVVAVPFGEAISLPLCLVHTVAHFHVLERGIGAVASGALLVVRALARSSASATFLAVPVPPPSAWHFVVLGVGALGVAVTRTLGWRDPPSADVGGSLSTTSPPMARLFALATLAALAVVELAARHAGRPHGVLRMTALDVGQGDASLVDLPDGKLMLVDGGGFVGSPVNPGSSVIVPILRARRRSRLDIVVLSHPHPDHYLGLAAALPTVDVGELWDTGQGRAEGAGSEYHAMLRELEARRVPIFGPSEVCGSGRVVGGARFDVFAPCPSFEPGMGANDNSFVFRVRHGARGVLFMGDAEHFEEENLLAEHRAELSADVLKTGHHGSRTSTSAALLRAVRPSLATVSCGVRNRFGHPHPTTLATLATAGVLAARTDILGSVQWSSDGQAEMALTFGSAPNSGSLPGP